MASDIEDTRSRNPQVRRTNLDETARQGVARVVVEWEAAEPVLFLRDTIS